MQLVPNKVKQFLCCFLQNTCFLSRSKVDLQDKFLSLSQHVCDNETIALKKVSARMLWCLKGYKEEEANLMVTLYSITARWGSWEVSAFCCLQFRASQHNCSAKCPEKWLEAPSLAIPLHPVTTNVAHFVGLTVLVSSLHSLETNLKEAVWHTAIVIPSSDFAPNVSLVKESVRKVKHNGLSTVCIRQVITKSIAL